MDGNLPKADTINGDLSVDDKTFNARILRKLPLADSVWRVLHYTMADDWLDDLWQRHRGRCYERVLKFSTLAQLVCDALVEHGGSGRQSFERGREADKLPVSNGSAYEKLSHLPLPLSAAMLEEGTQRLYEILPAQKTEDWFPLPDCWKGHELNGVKFPQVSGQQNVIKNIKQLY
jgi:hypothetical protein